MRLIFGSRTFLFKTYLESLSFELIFTTNCLHIYIPCIHTRTFIYKGLSISWFQKYETGIRHRRTKL